MRFQDLVRQLANSTYLDIVDQPGPDYEEVEAQMTEAADDDMRQEIFDMCCEAHNDLHRTRGSSPLQSMIGRTPRGGGLEADRPRGQRSTEVTDIIERSRLEVKTVCYKAYVEEEMSIQQNRKALHQARKWRTWASGEWCWYWHSSTSNRKRTPKVGVFRGPARVLMQERDVTGEGSTLRGVVWVADGASMVRVSPSNL